MTRLDFLIVILSYAINVLSLFLPCDFDETISIFK